MQSDFSVAKIYLEGLEGDIGAAEIDLKDYTRVKQASEERKNKGVESGEQLCLKLQTFSFNDFLSRFST